MKKIRTALVVLGIMLGFGVLSPAGAYAEGVIDTQCDGVVNSSVCSQNSKSDGSNSFVGTIVNTLLYIVGALAVLMIIVGGIMYVVSAGNSGQVTQAKNTIIYAVIGFGVAFLAYALVNWVFKLFA